MVGEGHAPRCGSTCARGEKGNDPFFGQERGCLDLHFIAPRALYEVLDADPQWDEAAAAIWGAIDAVIPAGYVRGRTWVRAALIDPCDDWRREFEHSCSSAPDAREREEFEDGA
jgi:hypothetical protein